MQRFFANAACEYFTCNQSLVPEQQKQCRKKAVCKRSLHRCIEISDALYVILHYLTRNLSGPVSTDKPFGNLPSRHVCAHIDGLGQPDFPRHQNPSFLRQYQHTRKQNDTHRIHSACSAFALLSCKAYAAQIEYLHSCRKTQSRSSLVSAPVVRPRSQRESYASVAFCLEQTILTNFATNNCH